MPTWLLRILGLNWATTISGITAIVAAFGRIALAWKARDFAAVINDSQLILETIGLLMLGFGLINAKDKNVTGVGAQAKAVDSSGQVTNVEGETIAKQSPVPPQPQR